MNPLQNQQDYQNFKPNKDTFSTQYSSSFEDLVSFYKEMNEGPEKESDKVNNTVSAKEETSEKEAESLNSENKTEEKSKSENPKTVEKTESEDTKDSVSEKNEVKKPAKNDVQKTDEKANLNVKKEDGKQLSLAEIKVKTDEKVEKKPAAETKKLTKKDFARIEELTQDKTLENPALAINNALEKTEVDDNGCPILEKLNLDKIARRVQFHYGNDILLNSSYTALNDVISIMRHNKAIFIEIQCSVKIDETSNPLSLSVSRVNAIYEYMVNKGIQENRLKATGYGLHLPSNVRGHTKLNPVGIRFLPQNSF